MRAPSLPEQLFVSTTPGLESILADEAAHLGPVRPVEGGVLLEGEAGLHRKANLELRVAGRVLQRIANLEADSPIRLQRALERLDLSPWRTREGFAIGSVEVKGGPVHRGELTRLVTQTLGLVNPPSRDPQAQEHFAQGPVGLWLRASGTRLSVSVDTSGELLYRRGYRQEVSRAPLRETLAAGILALAGHRPDEPLVDPMCGSGTFLIEGLWRSMGRAPGLQRPFAFESFPSHDAAAWQAERAAAAQREGPACPAFGFDLNAGALGTARRNARRAGVQEQLELERRDIAALAPPPVGPGLVVVNPPYGKRVGEREELLVLYRALGEALRGRFTGWRAAVLVPARELSAALGLPNPKEYALDNGGLPVTLQIANL